MNEIETKIKVNSKLKDDKSLNKDENGLKKPINPTDKKMIAIEAVILFKSFTIYNLLKECFRYPWKNKVYFFEFGILTRLFKIISASNFLILFNNPE